VKQKTDTRGTHQVFYF